MAHGPAPDPVAAFIAKWQANTRNERAACQEHFIDLCHLLDEPTPNTDPDGSNYAFEKGATKATGGDGWADVWRRGCFGWEYKGKHKDLDAAHRQLLQYAGALGNPPLLVVSDIARIVIRTNWTNTVSERHEVLLSDLADPAKRALLKAVLADPERLRPGKTREALTAQAAAEFAELARRLRDRGHDAQAVAHFVNCLVFCLFADDVDLLPPGLFEQMLAVARRSPGDFAEHARTLFHAMAQRGGRVGFVPVQWFNGGLFNDDSALPLDAADIALLERAAALDWAEIDPSILGTLFERGLDPDKRSQLGAHYTDREKIERLVDPVVRRPLLAEWAKAKTRIMELLAKVPPEPRETAAARRAKAAAKAELSAFLDRLRAFRVLDPACGSGNFLYLSLLALKDIEHQAIVEAEALGMQQEFRQVGPEAVLGIEINPYAAELARVSVWIGHIQWARRHGLPPPADPVLRPLDTIECRDAVLAPDGLRRPGRRRMPSWGTRRFWATRQCWVCWAPTTRQNCDGPTRGGYRAALIWSAIGLRRRGTHWNAEWSHGPGWSERTASEAALIAPCWTASPAAVRSLRHGAMRHGPSKERPCACRWYASVARHRAYAGSMVRR